MSGRNGELSQKASRLVKDSELSQHRPSVVVDFFTGQAVVTIERVHAAKGELNSSSGGRKTAPRAEVRSTNNYPDQDGFVCDMPVLNLNRQVGQRPHQFLIEGPDAVPTLEVFVPGLVIIPRCIAKRAENSLEIVFVLQPDVLLHDRDSRSCSVFRSRYAGHVTVAMHYEIDGRSFYYIGRNIEPQILPSPIAFRGTRLRKRASRAKPHPTRRNRIKTEFSTRATYRDLLPYIMLATESPFAFPSSLVPGG